MKTVRMVACVAVSLAALFQLGAVTIDLEGGSHTLDPATELDAEFTNSSDTQATLAIDATEALTFAGSIAGNIKLVKTGSAQLDVAQVNDFSGGVSLNAGVLNFTVAGSLGDGTITIASGATLQLGAAVECANPIHLMATTSVVKFGFSSGTGSFGGAITGESGVTSFAPQGAANKNGYGRFKGTINLPNASLSNASTIKEGYIYFDAPVCVKSVAHTSDNKAGFQFLAAGNSWNYINYNITGSNKKMSFAAGALPSGSYITQTSGTRRAYEFTVAGDQSFAYFTHDKTDKTMTITATSDATVTLGSEVEKTGKAQVSGAYQLKGSLGVVYSPEQNSTWTISSGMSTMTGSLTVQKGVLSVGGTATFANVPKIVVAAGAAFSCTSTGAAPLKSLKHLDLGTDATLTLGDGIEVVLESYCVNGALAAVAEGWYTGTDNPNPQAGDKQTIAMLKGTGRVYIPYQGSSSEATWNGGAGDDTSVTTGANWVGGSAPNLEGGLTATFATDGSVATFSEPATLEKIVLNRTTGFTLAAGSDEASVSLASGMEIAAPTDDVPVTNVVAVPMNLSAAQAWLTPANTVLELRAPISSEGPTLFDLGGAGTYAYYGTNTFSGTVYLTNGTHRVYTKSGAFGAATAGSIVDYRSSSGAKLRLEDTVIEKDFKMTKASGNNAGGITFAGTTNEFAGSVAMGANWTPGATGRVIFSGGGSISSYFRPTSGTYVFAGKPISIGTGYLLKSTHIFEVASDEVADITMNQSSDLWLRAPMAFKDRPALTQDAATGADNNAIVHLEGNDQEFGHLKLNNQYGWFETPKGKPARLSFKQTSDTALRTTAFRGPLSLEIVGMGTNTVTVGGAIQATGGDLSVTNVTLSIDERGSFASVTNVAVAGSATVLSVAQGQPFARRPNLSLAGGAKVDVPAGVVLRVHELRVDGELLCGEITAVTHPDVVSGEGKIRTSGVGVILLVK